MGPSRIVLVVESLLYIIAQEGVFSKKMEGCVKSIVGGCLHQNLSPSPTWLYDLCMWNDSILGYKSVPMLYTLRALEPLSLSQNI